MCMGVGEVGQSSVNYQFILILICEHIEDEVKC